MAVFVCGLNPRGNAFRDGRMHEGDIVLEANGILLHHRHHLNASGIPWALQGSESSTHCCKSVSSFIITMLQGHIFVHNSTVLF